MTLLVCLWNYFINYRVIESKLQSPDDTHFRATNNDELYADRCLIGTMKIISIVFGTLSHGVNTHKLLNNDNNKKKY